MALRLTVPALRDLDELDLYLSDKSPQGLKNVLAAIKQQFLLIEAHPLIGRPALDERLRVVIEPKYGYQIPYVLLGRDLWILRVYNARRAPLDLSTLVLP